MAAGDTNYTGNLALVTSALMGGKTVILNIADTACHPGTTMGLAGVTLTNGN